MTDAPEFADDGDIPPIMDEVAEHMRVEHNLRDMLLNLEIAEREAGLGSWFFDVRTGHGWWSQQMYSLFSHDPASGVPSNDVYMALIHPEDRGLLAQTMEYMAQGNLPEIRDFRTNPACGPMRVLSPRYRIEKDASGEIIRFTGTLLDVTERVHAEAHVLYLASLVDSVSEAIISSDTNFIIRSWNKGAEAIYGWRAEEVIGRSVSDTIRLESANGDYGQTFNEFYAKGAWKGEVIQYHKDGSPLHIFSAVSVVHDTGGRPVGIVAANSDITARKQAELALRSSEEKYRGLMQSLDSVIVAVDAEGRFLYMNDVAAAQMGSSADALINQTMGDLFPDPVASAQMDAVLRVIREDRGFVFEAQSLVRGVPRWYRTSIQPIHDEHGQVAYAMLNATDIHELKTVQQELLELTRTLEARVKARTAEIQDLYDHAPAGYHSLDAGGNFLMVNQTELEWLGYTRDELIGRPIMDVMTAESIITFRGHYPDFKRHGLLRDIEFVFLRKDGTSIPVLVSATAIYSEDGSFLMSRSTVFDNTEHKRAEETLRFANAEMERALRTKDEFLANMSHELRTPLNAILALSESLQEGVRGPLNDRQRESVGRIEESGQHLLTLINDILDLSKIEAGRLDLQIEAVSVADVCRASLQFIKEVAIKKQLKLAFQLNDELAIIGADAKRLKQILVNLLSNASKFTPAGGKVSLDVKVQTEDALVHFIVQDTGIGIADSDMARLFQPFTQLDSRLSRQHEGTGLGLVLVRRLVDLHGGSITVESEVGVGSRFMITLPHRPWQVEPPPAAQPRAESADVAAQALPPTGARVLLAEDNEINLEAVHDYLSGKGFQVSVARSGREALAQAELTLPDVILMDIQMPEMDGLEAIAHLREKPAWATTPIIALTALAMPGDRERCLAAGADEYLAKPLSLRGLVELIQRLLKA
ncbi:PAS domain S-box protein [Chloroflexales bacterium ZM16-3]|nr:PAS domain S-box protein [Chloroflexales bacterium ZM16-3]